MLGRSAHRHTEELRVRASQQAALAALGQQALSGMPLDQLLDTSAATVARELAVGRVAILERTRDGRGMLARAGVGLPDGVLGGVLPVDPGQLARDLRSESVSSAVIGVPGREFGVIEAHSPAQGHFSAEDSHFLQSVANVIGAAVDRTAHEDLVRDSEAQFRELADTTPALMWMTDAEGDVTFVNRGWLRFTGGELGQIGGLFGASAHPDDRDELLRCWTEASHRR